MANTLTPAQQSFLGQLFAALERAELPIESREFADALWLLQFRHAHAGEAPTTTDAPKALDDSAPPERIGAPRVDRPSQVPELPVPISPTPAPGVGVHMGGGAKGETSRRGTRAIAAPRASALPHTRALAAALRPLARRVPSRTITVPDLPQTIARYAASGVFEPVLKYQKERWLRLMLVVEDAPGSELWADTTREIRRFLETLGSFRDVRSWRLSTSDPGPPKLHPGKSTDTALSQPRNPRELHDPEGRTLILVVSPMISAAWTDGRLACYLSDWHAHTPLTLLTLVPGSFWNRTALGQLEHVRLNSPDRVKANATYRAEPMGLSLGEFPADALRVPVVTLDPSALKPWAKFVAVGGANSALGVIVPREPIAPDDVFSSEELTPLQQYEQFRRIASPLARRLMASVAVAPVVSLPVIRLVRQAVLPTAGTLEEAEVLFSGLLQLDPTTRGENPDSLRYAFDPEIRSQLLNSVPADVAIDVLRRVSEFVGAKLGSGRSFQALLDDPTAAEGELIATETPFATLAAEVLTRLGGDYAKLISDGKPPRPTRVEPELILETPDLGPLVDPRLIDGYRLERYLGGEMYGHVWQARRIITDTTVTLRIIELELGTHTIRDFDLLKSLPTLSHPYLVPIYDIRIVYDDDRFADLADTALLQQLQTEKRLSAIIVTSEWYRYSLEQYYAQTPGYQASDNQLSQDKLLIHMQQLAAALDYLHSQTYGPNDSPIVFQNLRPEVLLATDDGQLQLANCITSVIEPNVRSTWFPAAPTYAPPELANGRPVPRSDQYSLAIVYFKLRTGEVPIDPTLGRLGILFAHAQGELDFTRGKLSDAEREVIRFATTLNPKYRYASCTKFLYQLERAYRQQPAFSPQALNARNFLEALDPGIETSSQRNLERVRPPRVRIGYKVETRETVESRELPFVVGVLADLAGDAVTPERVHPRHYYEIDRDNFDDVMKSIGPKLRFPVSYYPRPGETGWDLNVELHFNSFDSFHPFAIAEQIPALKTLLEPPDRDSALSVDDDADRESVLNQALCKILQFPKLRRLESAWRGLHHLVFNTETSETLKIVVFPVPRSEVQKLNTESHPRTLVDRLEHFLQHFKLSLLVYDEVFNRREQESDSAVLWSLCRMAMDFHVPLVASTRVFNRDDLVNQNATTRDWRLFQTKLEAKYVALTLPSVVARGLYENEPLGDSGLSFTEYLPSVEHVNVLKMNAVWLYAVCVTTAFARDSWLMATCGLQGGGLVSGLPTAIRTRNSDGVVVSQSVETVINDQTAGEMASNGFLPLVTEPNTGRSAFIHSTTAYRVPNDSERWENQLNVRLCALRFVNGIKAMVRDNDWWDLRAAELKSRVNRWLLLYTHPNPDRLDSVGRAKHPLKDFNLTVTQAETDRFDVELTVWLQYQCGGEFPTITIPFRLEK